jgi:hypothetical protein
MHRTATVAAAINEQLRRHNLPLPPQPILSRCEQREKHENAPLNESFHNSTVVFRVDRVSTRSQFWPG